MTFRTQFESLSQHVLARLPGAAVYDQRLVAEILAAADGLRKESTRDLRARGEPLRQRVQAGEAVTSRSILTASFALVHEAARRTLERELFEVQHRAALALVRGSVAEMQTGEGKTLAAALAAATLALEGQGVHVVTTNAYLAQRDYHELAPLYELLGLSVGVLIEGDPAEKHRAAYACDITYGTGYEVGFDYLRDQLALLRQPKPQLGDELRSRLRGRHLDAPQARQRGQAVAIIDEIDSVLLDEGCLPLVLCEQPAGQTVDAAPYARALACAERLAPGVDFFIEGRSIRLTDAGLAALHRDAHDAGSLGLTRPWRAYVEQALRALHLLARDVDYVVQDGRILLVDPSTGRIFSDRSWRDGLQQLVETREGLVVTPEPATAVRISRQRYFRLYRKICGMTGTASGTEREFSATYRMPVAPIPLRVKSRRSVMPDRFFVSTEAKWQAVVAAVGTVSASGRPVLVGTRTIADSQLVSDRLTAAGLAHQMLNGRQDAHEAAVIARAGQRGCVTVATNMAGRGTDIKLGTGVARLGGLHVIGAERNLSARIDRQLAGRAARQGDPGSCQFFVSANDELIALATGPLRERMQTAPNRGGELALDYSADIARVQTRLEAEASYERRRMLARDKWLEELASRLSY